MKWSSVQRVFVGLALWTWAAGIGHADYKQAVTLYNQGQFDRAIQELKPDLDKNPDWEFGHRLVGLSYLGLKNNALAVSSLSRAAQLKSTSFSTYQGLAQAYFNRMEKYSEAASELTNAIRIKGTDWTAFSQLGIANYQLNRYDDAIQALQKALTLKPGHTATTEFVAKAYFKQGVSALSAKQYDRAIEFLRKARESNPKDGFIYYNLGEAYLFKNNTAEAEKTLSQALELMPRSAEVFQRMGLVYEKQKKWDLALNAYKKANELKASPALKESIDRVTENKKR
jgi:tetratricopeptide (TPR) repeat protein